MHGSSLEQQMGSLSLGKTGEPAKSFLHKSDGLCSVFPLNIRPGDTNVFRYDVDMSKIAPAREEVIEKPLTGRSADDGQRSLHRRVCSEVMESVYNRTEAFGTQRQCLYVYDSKKNLFTNMPIQLREEVFELRKVELGQQCQPFLRDRDVIRIRITRSEAWKLDLNDMKPSMVTDTALQADHSLRTFLELLTSQPFLNANTHSIIGMGQLFEIAPKPSRQPLAGGIKTHQGIAKGVRIIDNFGRPKPALVVDVKTCAFYPSTVPFDQVVSEWMGDVRARGDATDKFWCQVQALYKGVRGHLIYDNSRSIVLYKFTREPMSQLQIDGEYFESFYRRTKGITLNNLHWPAIRAEGSQNNLFPIQCVQIMPNQRVPLEKMSETISRALLEANTTDPNYRYLNIVEQIRFLSSRPRSDFLAAFGVQIQMPAADGTKPNSVSIGVRDAPQIEFGGHEYVKPENGRFNDRNKKYFLPGRRIDSWLVAYSRAIRDEREVRDYTNHIIRYAGQKGLELPPRPDFRQIDMRDMDGAMKEMIAGGKPPRMVLYYDSRRNKNHDMLKLLEQRYKIITQQLNVETFGKAGAATYTNIANKLNCKLFGLNYVPIIEKQATKYDLRSGNVLVIGLDVSHPAKASAYEMYQLKSKFKQMGKECPPVDSTDPSVVGICANYAADPNIFVGDYFYQQSRREAISQEALTAQMTQILERLMKNRKSRQPPGIVFVVRDGVSEGQFPMAVRDEFPALKAGCAQYNPGYHPKFVFVIVSKRHQKRFFDQQQQRDGTVCMNPTPGSVIDTKMVRADVPEFWMQSHRPLKGTAKLPQYAVPVDEVGMKADELQAFLNALCYSHQIVTSAVSIPEPVYQAHELAKRGSNNFKKFKENVPRVGDTHLVDCGQLTRLLSYGTNALVDTRFTA